VVRAARTQDERSAATQQALLRATISCLADLGYAATTTRVVCERAGVSRGAQTHHFPTKRELVVAAVELLFDVHARRFRTTFDGLDPAERTPAAAVQALWDIATSPDYAAILEVVVAARTDPELRAVVHATAATLEETVVDLLLWYSPAVSDRTAARRSVDLAVALVQGAAVSRLGGYGDPDQVVRTAAALFDAATLTTSQEAP